MRVHKVKKFKTTKTSLANKAIHSILAIKYNLSRLSDLMNQLQESSKQPHMISTEEVEEAIKQYILLPAAEDLIYRYDLNPFNDEVLECRSLSEELREIYPSKTEHKVE